MSCRFGATTLVESRPGADAVHGLVEPIQIRAALVAVCVERGPGANPVSEVDDIVTLDTAVSRPKYKRFKSPMDAP